MSTESRCDKVCVMKSSPDVLWQRFKNLIWWFQFWSHPICTHNSENSLIFTGEPSIQGYGNKSSELAKVKVKYMFFDAPHYVGQQLMNDKVFFYCWILHFLYHHFTRPHLVYMHRTRIKQALNCFKLDTGKSSKSVKPRQRNDACIWLCKS